MYIRFSSAIQSAKFQSYRHWYQDHVFLWKSSLYQNSYIRWHSTTCKSYNNIWSFKRNHWRKHKWEIEENDNNEGHLIYIPIFVFDLVYILDFLNLWSDSYLFLYFVPTLIIGRFLVFLHELGMWLTIKILYLNICKVLLSLIINACTY